MELTFAFIGGGVGILYFSDNRKDFLLVWGERNLKSVDFSDFCSSQVYSIMYTSFPSIENGF